MPELVREELLSDVVGEWPGQWRDGSFLFRNKLLMFRFRKTGTGSCDCFYLVLFNI